jgi:SAM-dependent methyltransferase
MRGGLRPWHLACPACGHESAALAPTINDARSHARVDERDREVALEALRRDNFAEIVAAIRTCARPGARRLLDVGCAHGWFLEQAGRHFDVLGLEPDDAVGTAAAARGLPVRSGWFPDALRDDERFDAIVFNDVIEHIPDIGAALDACRVRLEPGGLLVLNLPSRSGVFYRLASLFVRIGWSGPFDRMWQKGLPSPHVHYFDAAGLSRLLERHGFEQVRAFTLPSLRASGLMERLRFTGDASRLALYLQYAVLRVTIPLLGLLPSDIMVGVFRRR